MKSLTRRLHRARPLTVENKGLILHPELCSKSSAEQYWDIVFIQ